MPLLRAGPLLLVLLAACGEINSRPDAGFYNRTDAGAADAGAVAHDSILVQFVIDGDTVSLAAGPDAKAPDGRGLTGAKVRLLGIDAPEIAHPATATQPATDADCWGNEAKGAAQSMLAAKRVTLRYDQANGHDLRDAFDRLLAYVVLPTGEVANEELLKQGHARSFRAFPHIYTDRYNALEAEAKRAHLGMWSCP